MSGGSAARWSVYIVRCADDSLYTGIARNIIRRIEEHNLGRIGARYTRARRPVVLVYHETSDSRSAALKRERQIKRLTRRRKELLVASSAMMG